MYTDGSDIEERNGATAAASNDPDYVLEVGEEEEDDDDESEEDNWVGKDHVPEAIPEVDYDRDDPPMLVGRIYPNIQ